MHGNQQQHGGRVAATVMALFAGASFGVGGALSQIAKTYGIGAGLLAIVQVLAALIVLGVLVAVKFRSSIPRKQALQLIALGMANVLTTITYYMAIDRISVGAAVAIMFQYVWIAVVYQCVIERTRPSKWIVISAVLVVVGALMASGLAEELMSGGFRFDIAGIVLALVCAVFYALFIYMNSRIATEHHPVPRSLYLTIGGVILSIAAIPVLDIGELPSLGAMVPWGFLMGMIMTVIPTLCIVAATKHLSGGIVAILTSTELPVAVAAGVLLLGEGVTPISIAGVAIILVAIVLSEADGFLAKRKGRTAGDIAG